MPESALSHTPALLVLVPLVAASLAFIVGFALGRVVAIVTSVLLLAGAVQLAATVSAHGVLTYELGGWRAPLGIVLMVDGLAATMVLVTAVVSCGITVYAAGYFGDQERYRLFWALWLFLVASILALFLTGDVFNLYVCLELVSIAGVALVAISGRKDALFAAMRYLLAAIFGSILYLLGVALLYGAFGTLDIRGLADVITSDATGYAAFAFMTVGLIMKTALFPAHFWLPPAHSSAPSPVSAALSALVVKCSFYILVRLWVDVAGSSYIVGAGLLLGVLGIGAIVWGSVQALRQERLKVLVAYSTVAQIGYLFILFPLVALGGAYVVDAWSAGIFHVASHALAKAGMFLAAGAVLARLGHDRIEELRGLGSRAPLAAMAFGLAGVTMVGLPPSGGFVVKWLYITAALEAGAWWWGVVVLLGGLLAAVYIARVVALTLSRPEPETSTAESVPRGRTALMEYSALGLSLGSLVLGVAAQPLLDLMVVGSSLAAQRVMP